MSEPRDWKLSNIIGDAGTVTRSTRHALYVYCGEPREQVAALLTDAGHRISCPPRHAHLIIVHRGKRFGDLPEQGRENKWFDRRPAGPWRQP